MLQTLPADELPNETGLGANDGQNNVSKGSSGQTTIGPESMSDAESSGTAEAPTAVRLALVPLTPDDSHAPSLRRSPREHKKPRPNYAASQAELSDKPYSINP